MKNLVAVVVTYNRADFLQNLLDSFSRLTTRPDRIVVVDNASTDHTAAGKFHQLQHDKGEGQF